MSLKLHLKYLLFFALGVFLVFCHAPKTENNTRVRAPKFVLPEQFKHLFKPDYETFSKITRDSLKLAFLEEFGSRHPVYRAEVMREVLRQTNDSANFKFHLKAGRLMAMGFMKNNSLDSALFYLNNTLRECILNPRHRDEYAECYRDLGIVYLNFSHHPEAITNFDKAIQIATIAGNKDRLFRYLTEIGSVYFSIREYEKARACFEKAVCTLKNSRIFRCWFFH
jgi:tetratricopeptide (TPR) repeat protein